MKIAVPKERRPREARVAATPDTVKRYVALGASVAVESGAGAGANITDQAYSEAGATVADRATTLAGADFVLKVQRPQTRSDGGIDGLGDYPDRAILIALHNPYGDLIGVDDYARKGLVTFAMEFMPRISRAQSMDVLSSQSNLAGYKAVIDAAETYGRCLPMMMTAAGRVNPARVFVMGAGVAGLQAIATAKRLGAIVSATDVRPAVKEQVQSLGATFVMVESEETKAAETAGGYAKEMSADYRRQQAELVAAHVKTQDIVITTALIPGRKAPILITAEMVASMKPGSVLVDLAVEQGGNVAGAKPDETVVVNGVSIIGHTNMPSRLAADASALYARNVYNFVELLIDRKTQQIAIDWNDEIVAGTCLTRDGKVVNTAVAKAVEEAGVGGGPATAPSPGAE